MEFDLRLLENMLDCNCDAGNKVNESTFTKIIRKWVNTVRDRNALVSQTHTSLEVSGGEGGRLLFQL